MRIGLITACYRPVVNGVTRMVDMYGARLEKAGHAVTIFTLGNSVSAHNGPAVVTSPAVPLGRTGYHIGLRYSREARALLSEMDIVHCHHLLMGLEFAQRYSRCPIVFTNHTRYDLYASAYSPISQPAADAIMHRLWPAMTDGCDAVIAPSPSMRQTLRDFGVHQRIEVIENGVDLERIRNPSAPRGKADYGFSEDSVLLVYVGRLSVEKNVERMLSQFTRAAEAVPALRLLIVGDGPLRGGLEKQARNLGHSDKVYFTGHVPSDKIPDHLAAADLFVTASTSEVHPLTVIEAIASGLPVVAYRSPGISDTIESGVTGLLVGEEDELAQAMMYLSGDSHLRSMMAAAAVQSASRYDIETTVRRTLDLYQELQGDAWQIEHARLPKRRISYVDRGIPTSWPGRFRHKRRSHDH
jgi:glycosyltransferase involved in cell wall biosynthesis